MRRVALILLVLVLPCVVGACGSTTFKPRKQMPSYVVSETVQPVDVNLNPIYRDP